MFFFYAISGRFFHDIKQVTINFESNGDDVFALKRDSYAHWGKTLWQGDGFSFILESAMVCFKICLA